ncbi:MAG TPA: flagellar motor switch protein FliG [Rhodanobacteraceae bacterium]
MTGAEKSAVLMLALGEHVAAQIMKNLDEPTINHLSSAMAHVGTLEQERVNEILTAFLGDVGDPPVRGVDGLHFVRDALVEVMGERKTQQIMEYIVRGDSTASIMDVVRRTDTSMLSEQLRTERPQVIALLLAQLDSAAGAELLSHLPDNLVQEAMYRYAKLNTVRPEVLSELAGVLGEQPSAHVDVSRLSDIGGPRRAADILNNLPVSKSKVLLDGVSTLDAKLGETIRENMVVFSDLVLIEARALQTLLREVPQDQLTAALKAAPPRVAEKLLANLSEHAREMVREDLKFGGSIRRSEAERAQKAILQTARRLDAEGKIAITRDEDLL